jgi:hypothetical protein
VSTSFLFCLNGERKGESVSNRSLSRGIALAIFFISLETGQASTP